jgi:hypothetical protein
MSIQVAELVAKLTLENTQFGRQIAQSDAQLQGLTATATKTEQAVGSGLSAGLGKVLPLMAVGGAAVAVLGNALKDATQAAAQEDVNIGHLGAALQANIPMWKGNTDAIEDTIAARQSLSFEDDKLRDSLAQLVTRTHDVNEALNLQSIAMDLARGQADRPRHRV